MDTNKQQFYVMELQNINSIKNTFDHVINASTLKSAKMQASKKQFFQGTILKVYSNKDCTNLVATKNNKGWL